MKVGDLFKDIQTYVVLFFKFLFLMDGTECKVFVKYFLVKSELPTSILQYINTEIQSSACVED